MTFGHFSYLFYMLVFTIIPIGILWGINFKFLKRNLKVIWIMILIGLTYQFIADPFAEEWGTWFFNKDKIVDIWILNFPIENSIFMILITIAISSAVLTYIYYQDTGKVDRFFKRK